MQYATNIMVMPFDVDSKTIIMMTLRGLAYGRRGHEKVHLRTGWRVRVA